MRKFLYLGALILISLTVVYMELQEEPLSARGNAPHHTQKGFRNPFPVFKQRGFSDFLKWILFERRKNRKEYEPTGYVLKKALNDGSFLRENQTEFTVTWVGHSTVLFQLNGMNILTDPMWSERASPVSFAGPKRHIEPGIAFEHLPEIHVVLITHNHYDHLDADTVRRLGNKPLYLVPLGIGNFLKKLGIDHYQECDWWDTIHHESLKFVCAPSQHFSSRGLFDRNKTLWCSWIVQGKRGRFYFAGDTGYSPLFKEIGKRFGPFDLACLPIGAYLPRWFMGPVHLSPGEAIRAYFDLQARKCLAVHWGTFSLADDPPDMAPHVFLEEIKNHNLSDKDVWLFDTGETRIVTP